MDEATKLELEEQRHTELREDLKALLGVFKTKKEDSAVKEFVRQNGELISNFVKKLENISKPVVPTVNVETNQDLVVVKIEELNKSINQLIPLMKNLVELEKADSEKESENEEWTFILNKNGHGITTGGAIKKIVSKPKI